jgi:hypothetical protein
MVFLALVGVGHGEIGDGFVKGVRFTHVASDFGGLAGAGVAVSNRTAAKFGVVVRKNSIRLPSDRDAGTYLFGFPALGSPKNQSCEQKMLLNRAEPVQPWQAMFRFFQNTKRSLDSLLNLITDLVADGFSSAVFCSARAHP